jgi:hypothetical protein
MQYARQRTYQKIHQETRPGTRLPIGQQTDQRIGLLTDRGTAGWGDRV